MTKEEFTQVAERALAGLPEEFKKRAAEVMLRVEPYPSEELCKEMELEDDEDIFGLYSEAASPLGPLAPNDTLVATITLFYEPLLDYCENEDELIREIQVTVLHELGHHLGMDEDDLTRLGYD